VKSIRIETEFKFVLRFYEQTTETILAVIERAKRSHPGISGWKQTTDRSGAKSCEVVSFDFKDRESLAAFQRDEQFIDTYLANAWGRRSLTRDALRVKPNRDGRGTIPQDMFADLGF